MKTRSQKVNEEDKNIKLATPTTSKAPADAIDNSAEPIFSQNLILTPRTSGIVDELLQDPSLEMANFSLVQHSQPLGLSQGQCETESPPPKEVDPGLLRKRRICSPKSYGKRPKADLVKCVICRKEVKKMYQHLNKVHHCKDRVKRFILSYHHTRIAAGRVWECVDCILRTANKTRHLQQNPGHNIVKVNDKAGYDTFPPEVSAFIKGEGRVSSKVFGIMKDFAQFKIDLQDAPVPGYVEAFLTHVYSNCGNMRNCSDLPRILTMYQAQKQYSLVSMKKLFFDLKNFLFFLKSTGDKSQKIPFNSWEAQIETYMRSIRKPATQEAFEKREERYNQIPPVEVLSKAVKGVRELLQEALCQFRESGELPCKRRKQGEGPRTLTMSEIISSVFFLIHARTNCRAGGLLNMTKEELDSVNTDIRRTHKHKTGHIMTNFCKLSEENLEWLTTFHEIYEQMHGRVAILAFPNADDGKLTAQATTINTIIGRNFDLKPYTFGPNSIRKHWDTMLEKDKFVTEDLRAAYEANSGHSEATRKKFYSKPPTDDEIERILSLQEKILEDPAYLKQLKEPQDAQGCSHWPSNELSPSEDEPVVPGEAIEAPDAAISESQTEGKFEIILCFPMLFCFLISTYRLPVAKWFYLL